MPAPQTVLDLVERFQRNYDAYRRADYNETQTRREFIDPLFMALGWDVDNRRGVAPIYQEVIHEATLRDREAARAPDYCFRVGRDAKFFVEAKKPSVDLDAAIQPAYQVRRYAWTAKLPLSVLTDFEQFSVYDCRTPPKPADKPTAARVLYVTYDQYPERWDEIAAIFSRDAVWRGDFDRWAEAASGKRGAQEVDDVFLQEIEQWRELLARNIALRNPAISVRALNHAVQQTIDRIIFLRICEDRNIEPYEQLKGALAGGGVYARLMELFRRADDRYNSGLFHFKVEKGRPDPDHVTAALTIDDKPLAEIIHSLYYPHSPYAFEVLSADILGNVYERFLGSVIRLTPGHQAKVEQKPEVRKAGGVYYTPKYIVDYIVEHTVGALLSGSGVRGSGSGTQDPRPETRDPKPAPLTPAEISKLRILDPACGSGSFLLGAYQHLLDYHLAWYTEHPTKHARREIYQGRGGRWFLTAEEKKRILLNNIYGVDIDPQAVEVTKLSLLLKVLEGETDATLPRQGELWQQRALPDLAANIKCGNSLIGPDYYDAQQLSFDEDEFLRVNAFDWRREFPAILGAGGFDVVIGNPPYVRQETLGDLKTYFQRRYQVYHGMADLYAYFIERGISLLRPGGLFGYIVANKWLRANYGAPLRRFLQEREIVEIVDFGDLPVFEQATTYPCIVRVRGASPHPSPLPQGEGAGPLSRTEEASGPLSPRERAGGEGQTFSVTQVDTLDFPSLDAYVHAHRYAVNRAALDDSGWALMDGRREALLAKLRAAGTPLGEYVGGKIYRGVLTGLNEAFVIDAAARDRLIAEDAASAEIIVPFLAGRDVKRYQPPTAERWLIFTRRGVNVKQYPAIERHLLQYKARLMPKPKSWKGGEWPGRKPGAYQWYEVQDTIDYWREFGKPKIIYPDIAAHSQFMYSPDEMYMVNTMYFLPVDDLYLLGLLNSKLIEFIVHSVSPPVRGGYYRYFSQYISQLPIAPADRARRDRMVALVEGMLELHRRLAAAGSPQERDALQRQIEIADRQIDRLVYDLYGLTEDEIALVEG